MATVIDRQDASLLVTDPPKYSFEEMVTMIEQFQDQLSSLDYRVTNKNFGSKIYQAKETISSKGRLIAGFGDQVVILDGQHPTYRIWAGNEDPALAPFSVDKLGNMVATSLDLSAYLQVGQSLTDLQGIITDISDINSDLGTIVAGNLVGITVTGGTVRTASSGTRVQMTGASASLEVYSGSTKRMQLNADTLSFYNSGGSETATIKASSFALDIGTTYAAYSGWSFNSSYGVYFQSGTTPVMLVHATGITMQSGAGANIAMSGGAINSCGTITPNSGKTAGTSGSPFSEVHTTDLYVYDDIIMNNGASADISTIGDIFFGGQASNPTVDGQLRYYDSGGTEGFRTQLGGSDFQFDATAV